VVRVLMSFESRLLTRPVGVRQAMAGSPAHSDATPASITAHTFQSKNPHSDGLAGAILGGHDLFSRERTAMMARRPTGGRRLGFG